MEITVHSNRAVPYSPEIAAMLKGVPYAIYFRQLQHGQKHKADVEGWFAFSVEDMRQATFLSRFQQESARALLVKLGWIETALRCRNGGAPTMHFRVLASVKVARP